MNKVYRYGIIILLIALAFVQIFCINKVKKDNNINACSTQNYKIKSKTITEIIDELSCLKYKTILSAVETNGKWNVKVKINGDKESLLDEISKLKDYNINNYTISKSEKEKYIILEISTKESA